MGHFNNREGGGGGYKTKGEWGTASLTPRGRVDGTGFSHAEWCGGGGATEHVLRKFKCGTLNF